MSIWNYIFIKSVFDEEQYEKKCNKLRNKKTMSMFMRKDWMNAPREYS